MDRNEYLQQVEKRWEKNWPGGMPREVQYPEGEILMTDYLRSRAQQIPDNPCVIYYGAEMTFRQLDDYSDRFAACLAGRGLEKGDRVAVFMPNCPQFLIAFYGILKLGCIHVPVNPLFKEAEFVYEIQDAGPKAIVALDLLYSLVSATREQTDLEVVFSTSLSDWLPEAPAFPIPDLTRIPRQECPGSEDLMTVIRDEAGSCPEVEVELDDIAALNYTGGTTGMPKGCEHTQRDMVYTAACGATFALGDPGGDDVLLTYLPIFWIAGEDAGVLAPVLSGVTEVLMIRWDAGAVLDAIPKYRVSIMYGLVDNMVELMDYPDVEKVDFSSLRETLVSSFVKKLNTEYRRQWRELTGTVMRESSYGMTETHTLDTFTAGMQKDDMDLASRPIFVGLPMPGTRFMVVDFVSGEPLPLNQEGEILVQTPSLMKAYWNKPEETARQLADGWLHTGDIGMIDDHGYLTYLGRSKEMLKVKGMSVFPSEVENLLGRHPAIAGSAVLGRTEEEKGEVPVAFIQLSPDQAGNIGEADLQVWCRENMAGYKVPEIRIVEELPLTATGKVKKEDLKERL
ncbi:MAG: AMP-binding protein [Desulfobacterales bacterium]|nr:AMP-binding protein [Desulfobacterales bacterium]